MTTTTRQPFEIRRGDDRGTTKIGWLYGRHSFSFGRYQDAEHMGYRSLRVLNDDVIKPGQGFGEHGHANMEIITWVLEGALRHGDSLGNAMVLTPGEVQVMSAGRGIRHSEFNASADEPVHLLQIWIEPAEMDTEPRYTQRAFPAAGRADRWQTLASGRGAAGAEPIGQDAEVRVAELSAGGAVDVDVDVDRFAYVHVATGEVIVDGVTLSGGDAIKVTGPTSLKLTGVASSQLLWFDLA